MVAVTSNDSPGGKSDRGYPDLHDHLEALDLAGHLITVDVPIN